MALMDANAPGCGVVWFGVSIGNFLFVNPGQSVRVVVVRVRIKLAQESRNMVVEFLVPGFPPERHNDMMIYKGRIGNNPGFLVIALVKRDGQRPNLFFHGLFVLGTAVVRFNPRFLYAIVVNHPGNGHGSMSVIRANNNGSYRRLFSFQIWFSDL